MRLALDVNGSPEYALTWKHWDMQSGPPICALRASARRTSGNDCSGWRSPDSNQRGGSYQDPEKILRRMEAGHQVNLEDQAVLTGWPTPDASAFQDGEGTETWLKRRAEMKAKGYNGNGCGTPLAIAAQFAGWPTATAKDAANAANAANKTATRAEGSRHHDGTTLVDAARMAGWATPTKGNADGSQIAKDASATGMRPDGSKATVSLNQVAQLTGWATPRAEDSESTGPHRGTPDTLTSQARLSGRATPTSRDHKDGASTLENTPTNALLGRQCQLSHAPTEKRGALNPSFSRWMMGFPAQWDLCAITAHSKLKRRRAK